MDIRVIIKLNRPFPWELVSPDSLLLVFAYNIDNFVSTCVACLDVVFEFEWREIYICSFRAKLILDAKINLTFNEPI